MGSCFTSRFAISASISSSGTSGISCQHFVQRLPIFFTKASASSPRPFMANQRGDSSINLIRRTATIMPATPQNTKIARHPNIGNRTSETKEANGVPQFAMRPTHA